MNFLNQCELWIERNEIWKVVQSIEEVPREKRTPALVSTLAWAYCLLAAGDQQLYEKSLRMLLPLREDLKDDYRWNFRMGFVTAALDRDRQAVIYFQKALLARPGDQQAKVLKEICERRLVCPLFERTFQERVKEGWKTFSANEKALQSAIDRAETKEAIEEGLALGRKIFYSVIRGVSFSLGKRGSAYVLSLSPSGSVITLWKIMHFLQAMPGELSERWICRAGRSADTHALSGAAEEVTVTWERTDQHCLFRLYSPDLAKKEKKEAEKEAMNLLCRSLGELTVMALGGEAQVAASSEGGMPLKDLPGALEAAGIRIVTDGYECLSLRARSYEGHPIRDRHSDWRLDVQHGYSSCLEPVDGYMAGNDRAADAFHRDGVAAGFFICRREDCPVKYKSAEEIEAALDQYLKGRGLADAVTFTGWAEGIYSFYVDFLAWDSRELLDGAEAFFRDEGFRQCGFHTFRRRVPTTYLLKKAEKEELEHMGEHKTILTREFVAHLEGYMGETEGYFEAMLHDLEAYMAEGAATGRFTPEEAKADLETALWYAYACLNVGTYETYWKAAKWMPASEKRAHGCGKWYYRYSVALMNCGRLEEAQSYAEAGVQEEPAYPWIWLQAGKLRSHFGDKEGALDAVERGLFLEPDNYEFQTLRREILRGASLEEMEYHWIDPESDKNLQEGLDEDTEEKRRALACITTDEKGLQDMIDLFDEPLPDTNNPYCVFRYVVCGHPIELVFLMNKAGLSKMNPEWVRKWKKELDSGSWLTRECGEDEGLLENVLIGLDYTIMLRYIPSRGDTFFDVPPAPARRRTTEEVPLEETAVLLKDQAWNPDTFAAALGAAGFAAENAGDDTVMAVKNELTAVLCFYNLTKEIPGLPLHRAYLTAAVIGNEDNGSMRQALLRTVLRICAAQPGAAGVLIGGKCFAPEEYLARTNEAT